MGYSQSIGGDPVNPNPFTYTGLSITANTTLAWPFNGQSATSNVTDWVDITASGAYSVTMPDTREVSIGREVVFNNYGAQTITVKDAAGGTITTLLAGNIKRIWVVTNATAAGTWRVGSLGGTTSAADASALAGYGLVALAGQLSQSMPVTTYNTNQTLGAGQRAYLIEWTGGSGTFTLTDPAALGSNWFTNIAHAGSGTLTLSPAAGLINGVSSITAVNGEGFQVVTDGANFFTLGKITVATTGLTQLSKSVAGSSNVTLTATESGYGILIFTGVLTGNINVIVPATIREWIIFNNTTGAFTLTVKTAAGTGIAVAQAGRKILYCDGTNVNIANDAGSGTVTSVATGTGLTGGPIVGAGTVTLANTAVTAGTYGAQIGYLTITVDAQGRLTSSAYTNRTLTGTAAEITVTNGTGAAADPTFSLPTALTFTGKTVTGGTFRAAGGTASAPGYSFSGDTNNGIFSSSADVVGIANGGTEYARFASGDVQFNTAVGNITGADLAISTDSTSTRGLIVQKSAATAGGCNLFIQKSRGTTGAPTICPAADAVGQLGFKAYDGASFIPTGHITGVTGASVALNNVPGYIKFSTNQGSTSATECMRLDEGGNQLFGYNGTTGVISTSATTGMPAIPTCAGAKTGTPTAYTGMAYQVYDTTNNKLYIWNPVSAAWKSATFA